jgi:protein-tyrosine phosphatase
LIRCQAGLNRSGLVTALVLIRFGLAAKEAIEQIRIRRAGHALCNESFEAWLLQREAAALAQRSSNRDDVEVA